MPPTNTVKNVKELISLLQSLDPNSRVLGLQDHCDGLRHAELCYEINDCGELVLYDGSILPY